MILKLKFQKQLLVVNILIEDLPGTGKTTFAIINRIFNLNFKRIQFTSYATK